MIYKRKRGIEDIPQRACKSSTNLFIGQQGSLLCSLHWYHEGQFYTHQLEMMMTKINRKEHKKEETSMRTKRETNT